MCRAALLTPGVGVATPSSEACGDTQRALQAVLLGFAGKPVQELVSVDLGAKLAELGLANFFPHEVGSLLLLLCPAWKVPKFCLQAWPDVNAVRELATKLKIRTKNGEKNPFLVVDLRK